MQIVLDVEATGLDISNDKVHCAVAYELPNDENGYEGAWWEFRPEHLCRIKTLVEESDKVIMHNGIAYDTPILKNNGIVDIPFRKIVDTLVLSRLYYPDREGGHSVEAWGKRLGFPKVEHSDWTEFSEDMFFRCKTDVEIQTEIYKTLLKEKGDHDWSLAEKIEHRIAKILHEQEQRGWKFRLTQAKELVQWLDSEMERVESEIQPKLSLYYEYKGDVNKPFKKDGTLSKISEDWLNEFKSNRSSGSSCNIIGRNSDSPSIGGYFGRIEWYPVRLSQRDKLAQKLIELGWEPTSYSPTGRPQLTPDKMPCPNLSKLGDIGEKLSHYFLCAHRRGQIKGWIENCREDERVPSVAIGNGTNTGRMQHRIIANVPKASEKVFLGSEMRDLFTHEDGYTLVGWDAEGLEMRVLAHYMNDPDFIEAVVSGKKEDKTDIHNVMLSASNGLIPDRDTEKNCLYCIVYGGGDWKLGSTAGYTKDAKAKGAAIRKAWAKRFPKLPQLVEQVTKASERGYLKAIDGRKVWVRRDPQGKIMSHRGLNTLIQSTGSILVKTAVTIADHWIKKEGLPAYPCIIYHDEAIREVDKEAVERYKELCYRAMKKTEEMYNFRCPLSIEVKEGNSWKEVH